MIELTPDLLALLFGAALLAGWVDAIAGGGGMITLPALLLTGMPPAAALATNKLQGSLGTGLAALFFWRRGAVGLRENLPAVLAVALGSILGSFVLLRIDAARLAALVPVLLILIGCYFLFFAGDLDRPRKPRLTVRRFNATVAPALGAYDGFFGPGTGSFFAAGFVALRGMAIRQATAHAKLFNFASNLSALIWFALFGEVAWLAGLVMLAGQAIGAPLGARTVLNAGARLVRPMVILICFTMSARLLWQAL